MPTDFVTYLSQINNAVIAENGNDLAYLLRPTSPQGKDLVKEFRNPTKQTLRRFEGAIMSPWDEIAISYVLTCSHVARKRPGEAFKEHSQLVSSFFRFFTENRGWTLPALFSILRDLRDLAFDADLHAKYNDEKSEAMEEAARIIAKAFSNCITDRTSPPDQSRKWGIYYVVGLILKCYFRVKRISLAKNILRALHANDIPPLTSYPRSHQVTYRYYIGMLNFLNEDFEKAEEELTLAFYHCHTGAHSNQERILMYLIPLRIIRGHLPANELLDRFPVLKRLYMPFISAIRKGDLSGFDRALDAAEHTLLGLNVWLTLEKAREICMRSLFRRAWIASDKSTRMPILVFYVSLKISGIEITLEEAECFVANMIHRGYIKGYISHERQMVVLSQASAFPKIADRQAPFSYMTL
ncbi:hypothetical protein AGABI1DRAFT_120015 [Agaricus bisporus var. burnettii JB137-S8]|uniref:PCI domain-containing protein n=1 Tax=Agaricus bisporus var. burnettii (strain JB137-S8 / ATCC MYA-4627 / FGSC 10392) TaxID=597362 RepID=K5XXF1_AGABU|nr:uncharacterized protein AGABI1DRAFT_120015 [Agaricus bisporus var. burnettii JB137-S8]EKM79970.1 hypothetical protein AGABI1DRAFT_120015 [Agaricus bisporus var. burnettii JB137-S8]